MAVTVVANLTQLYDASTTTGWTEDGMGVSTVSGFQKEGTENLGGQVSQGSGHAWKSINSTDLSNTRIYSWMGMFNAADTKANGGFRIVLGDGTNRVAYHVGGSDDFGFDTGLWNSFVLDTGNLGGMSFTTLQGSEGSLSLTAITEVGVGFNATAKALGNVDNVWWDVCRFGEGLSIKGGTSGDPGVFSEIVAEDELNANAYGIIRELEAGVFGLQGNLEFGDNVGTDETFFKDQDAVLVVEDHVHGTGTPTTIDITAVGNTTNPTHVEFGLPIGTGDDQQGSNGVQLRNANPSQTTSIDFSGANVDDLLMYGGAVLGFGTITFSSDGTHGPTHVLSGVAFDGNSQITLGAVVTRNCSFSGYTGTNAAVLWTSDIDIRNCAFRNNADATNSPSGIEVTTQSTFEFIGLTYAGNDFDVFNNSGGAITINISGGGDTPTVRNNDATINNNTAVTLTGMKDNTEVRVYDSATSDPQTELAGIEDATDGTTDDRSFTFTLGAGTIVDIVIHNITFETQRIDDFTIPTSDSEIPISQNNDRNYLNPL